MKKSEEKGPFFELTKRQRKAVVMLYEGTYTNKEIAEVLHCSESLIYKWKRENKLFQQARRQYETMIIEDKYVSEAMQSIYALVKTAKSEMVRLQAAISILKLAGRLTDSSTPELDKARSRKTNAEADIAEYKAKVLEESGSSGVELLNEYLDKLDTLSDKEVKQDGTKADV